MTTSDTPLELVKYPPGKHPNSAKNLKPFKKGTRSVSTNPEGYSITSRVKDLLKEKSSLIPPNADPNDLCYRDQIARQIVTKAAQGDTPMVKELWDRTDGKVAGDGDKGNTYNDIKVLIVREKPRELIEGIREEG